MINEATGSVRQYTCRLTKLVRHTTSPSDNRICRRFFSSSSCSHETHDKKSADFSSIQSSYGTLYTG